MQSTNMQSFFLSDVYPSAHARAPSDFTYKKHKLKDKIIKNFK